VEAERFAIELADELKSGLGHNKFAKLLIVASAHFYGLIKKHFHPAAPLEVIHISKDYTQCDPNELYAKLKEQIFI
jgi:protein required for attachment to host cells